MNYYAVRTKGNRWCVKADNEALAITSRKGALRLVEELWRLSQQARYISILDEEIEGEK